VAADQNFKPSRQKVSDALASLSDQAEVHRMKAVGRIPSTVRVAGHLSELDKGLLPLVRDPLGMALRSGIRRLGEVPSRFMTIDEIVEVAEEAARQFGDPGVRGVGVDKQWDGLRDKEGNCWIA